MLWLCSGHSRHYHYHQYEYVKSQYAILYMTFLVLVWAEQPCPFIDNSSVHFCTFKYSKEDLYDNTVILKLRIRNPWWANETYFMPGVVWDETNTNKINKSSVEPNYMWSRIVLDMVCQSIRILLLPLLGDTIHHWEEQAFVKLYANMKQFAFPGLGRQGMGKTLKEDLLIWSWSPCNS